MWLIIEQSIISLHVILVDWITKANHLSNNLSMIWVLETFIWLNLQIG